MTKTVETYKRSRDNDQTLYLSYEDGVLDGSRAKDLLSQYLNNQITSPIKVMIGISKRYKDDQPNRKIGNFAAKSNAKEVEIDPIPKTIRFSTPNMSGISNLDINFLASGGETLMLHWSFGCDKNGNKMLSGAPSISYYSNNNTYISKNL